MTVVNDLNTHASDHKATAAPIRTAVLDNAHLGDIHGALGSIAQDDIAQRTTLAARLKTLLEPEGLGDPRRRVRGAECAE
ncbi:hypothetical protein [Bradyrhizobium genosp. P]|uniref:hypothetical protein n=1 Tax=Bradyrhizobium genosp. P TaxID=83641 RepID=UPI003CEFE753